MGRAAKIRRIDELRAQRYRAALARAASSTKAEEEVHDTFIVELSEQINEAKREVHGNPSAVANVKQLQPGMATRVLQQTFQQPPPTKKCETIE